MINLIKLPAAILGLAISHIVCGVFTLLEGVNFLVRKFTGSTKYDTPQWLPIAEDYTRSSTKLLQESFHGKAADKSALPTSGKILIAKTLSYALAFAGLVKSVAVAAPILDPISGVVLGSICLSTAGYHLSVGAQSLNLRSKLWLLNKALELCGFRRPPNILERGNALTQKLTAMGQEIKDTKAANATQQESASSQHRNAEMARQRTPPKTPQL